MGWGGVGELELKSREESEIFMTHLCVFTASAGWPGGAALGRVPGRRESWMQSRGEWGHWSPLAHLGWLLPSLRIVDLEPIMVPASFLLPESLTTSLLANSTQNHIEKRILGNTIPSRTIQHVTFIINLSIH